VGHLGNLWFTGILLVLFLSFLFSNVALAQVSTITVGNGPFGIAVNPNTNKAYVSNLFSDYVSVLELVSGEKTLHTEIKQIVVDSPGHAVVNPDTNLIYVSSGATDTVVVIDGTTDTIVDFITVGDNPNGISVNTNTNRLYVANRGTDTISVIDGSTNSVIDTIDVGDLPLDVIVNPSTNMVYVANNKDLTVTVIDASSNTVVDTIDIIKVGTLENGPFGFAIDTNRNILYVLQCHIGKFPGIVTVIDVSPGSPTENTIIDNIPVFGPGHSDFDPINNRLYVTNQSGDAITIIDTTPGASTENTIIGTIPGGDFPHAARLNVPANLVYIVNFRTTLPPVIPALEDGTVTVVDITDLPPVSDAGPDQTVNEGTLVTLDGTRSTDPDGFLLSFSWEQTGGPAVTLLDETSPNPTFTSPLIDSQAVLSFQLTVNDGIFDNQDSVNILVKDLTSFEVVLTQTDDGVSGNIALGNLDAGTQFSLEFQTPMGVLSNGELDQTLITTGVDGTGVSISFEISSNTPQSLPALPIDSALFFDIDFEGIDFSDPLNFLSGQTPKTKFLINKDYETKNSFSDGCPVVSLFLFNDVTNTWDKQGDPLKPNTNKIYVANFVSDTVSVIDGSTNTIEVNIDVGNEPFELAFNPNTNMVYVTNQGSNTISVIDGSTNSVVDTIDVGTEPISIAVNENTNTLYVANQGSDKITVIDGSTNLEVVKIDVGTSPVGFGVNPITNRIYVANQGSDTISVIDGSTNVVTDTIAVDSAPSAIGVNPNTDRLYIANQGSDTVSVIDSSTNSVLTNIPVENLPISIVVDPATNNVLVFVANLFSDSVSVIDGSPGSPTENQLIINIEVGDGPSTVGINPNINRVYVTNNQDDTVSVIDSSSNTELTTIDVGSSPVGIVVNSDVPNPVRIPASDVLDVTTGEILQCAYIADKPHLSKFSIGGIKALFIGGGVSSTGGSAPALNSISYDGVTTTNDDGTIEFGGVIIDKILPINNLPTQTVETGDLFTLRLPFYEDNGVGSLQHVAVYFLQGDEKTIDDSQTSVIYRPNDPVEISDSPSFISNVTAEGIVKSAYDVDIIFEMVFNFPTDEPVDIKVRSWDKYRRSSDITFNDFLQVIESGSGPQLPVNTSNDVPSSWSKSVESSAIKSTTIFKEEFDGIQVTFDMKDGQSVTKNIKIPLWVKNNANWWSNDEITDDDFVAGMRYLIEQNMMNVPQHKVTILEPIHEIVLPDWVKNNAAWWADGLVSDREFVQAIEWLIDEEVMTV